MATNNNPFSPRGNYMSSSSMLFPNYNGDKRSNFAVNYTGILDKPEAIKPETHFNPNNDFTVNYQRAATSQSLIFMPSSDPKPNMRGTLSKLQSMARQVTKLNKDEPNLASSKLTQHTQNIKDQQNGSGYTWHSGQQNQYIGFGNNQGSRKLQTEPSVPTVVRHRRQSIDLHSDGIFGEKGQDNLKFLKRTAPPEQNSRSHLAADEFPVTSHSQIIKPKHFDFLKRRKEYVATEPAYIGMHQPIQLSGYAPSPFQKPEGIWTQGKGDVKITVEDKGNTGSPGRGSQFGQTFSAIQFKKKKPFDSPNEPSKTLISRQSPPTTFGGEIMTMKQRRAAKLQREITLADFQLIEKLGKGAFGDVFIAQQKHIGFVCVIKKMSKKRIKDAKVEQHVLRQIKIQSYLNHYHLTSLYGSFQDQENIYLILELLSDGSLQQVKKKKKIPQKQTSQIVKQVAQGLKYMHQQYIIHRDLKPQNLFMNQGYVKIGDFGCSIYHHDTRLRNTVVGCLEYSSPEQLCQEGYSDKIDSWSLGILTYELLFGKSPFESDIIKIAKNKDLKPQLSEIVFPSNPPIREQTKDFIIKLLLEDPEARIDIDEVLQHPFIKVDTDSTKKTGQLNLFSH